MYQLLCDYLLQDDKMFGGNIGQWDDNSLWDEIFIDMTGTTM